MYWKGELLLACCITITILRISVSSVVQKQPDLCTWSDCLMDLRKGRKEAIILIQTYERSVSAYSWVHIITSYSSVKGVRMVQQEANENLLGEFLSVEDNAFWKAVPEHEDAARHFPKDPARSVRLSQLIWLTERTPSSNMSRVFNLTGPKSLATIHLLIRI